MAVDRLYNSYLNINMKILLKYALCKNVRQITNFLFGVRDFLRTHVFLK